MFKEVFDWLFKNDNLCVIHSLRDSHVDQALSSMLKVVYGSEQVLILDLDGRVQIIPKNWRLIQITGIREQISHTIDLHKYLNPRLRMVFISGFPTYLQGFQGVQALKDAESIKQAAFFMSILRELSEEVFVLIKTYQTSEGLPSFSVVSNYYTQNIVSVKKVEDSIEFSRNGEVKSI